MSKAAEILSIPFAGSWGLRLRAWRGIWCTGDLSIPFAGSWGLRLHEEPTMSTIKILSIPFAGSWGLRPTIWPAKPEPEPTFNPVCRELGAPPSRRARVLPTLRLSIPFAGSWGLRPLARVFGHADMNFQSRLPGVGGSASSRLGWSERCFMPFNPVCRELGAPPYVVRTARATGGKLSIPFAGSWGLRQGGLATS